MCFLLFSCRSIVSPSEIAAPTPTAAPVQLPPPVASLHNARCISRQCSPTPLFHCRAFSGFFESNFFPEPGPRFRHLQLPGSSASGNWYQRNAGFQCDMMGVCCSPTDGSGRYSVRRGKRAGIPYSGQCRGVYLKINGKPARSQGRSGEVVRIRINEKNLQDLLDPTAG